MSNEIKVLSCKSASIKSIEVEGKIFTQLHVIHEQNQTRYTWNAYILLQRLIDKEKLLEYLSNALVRQVLTLAVQNNITDRTNRHITNSYRGLLLAEHLSNKARIGLSEDECIESVRALLEVNNVIKHQFLGLNFTPFINEEGNLILSQLLY